MDGRVLSGLGVLFMIVDAMAKVLDLIPTEAKAANSLGWSDHSLPLIGVIALICTALYLIPRTAVLGATTPRPRCARKTMSSQITVRGANKP